MGPCTTGLELFREVSSTLLPAVSWGKTVASSASAPGVWAGAAQAIATDFLMVLMWTEHSSGEEHRNSWALVSQTRTFFSRASSPRMAENSAAPQLPLKIRMICPGSSRPRRAWATGAWPVARVCTRTAPAPRTAWVSLSVAETGNRPSTAPVAVIPSRLRAAAWPPSRQ